MSARARRPIRPAAATRRRRGFLRRRAVGRHRHGRDPRDVGHVVLVDGRVVGKPNHVRTGEPSLGVGREPRAVLPQQFGEPWLEHRRLASLQHLDDPLVRVEADDVVTLRGETDRGHGAEMTQSEDTDTHGAS